MSISLRLKHSATANKVPLPADLAEGELALNINNASPGAYLKDSTGVVRKIAGITVGGTAPATPTAGMAWLDVAVPTKPVFKVYDGTAWQGAGSGVGVGTTAPTAPAAGDLWVDTTVPTAPVVNIWNGTAFVPVVPAAVVVPDATETVKGIVELATAAETTTGTDATRAVHPAGLKVELDKKANLASPTFTGTPAAPTAAVGTNTTQVATTAFVHAADKWTRTGTTLSPATAGDTIQGNLVPTNGAFGTRNRIINGDMRIDQRNDGASVNNIAGGLVTLDRWSAYGAQAAKFSTQRNLNSVTPPSGFTNYLGVSSLAATSVGASEFYGIYQVIEGFNASDFAWGTATAQAVTASFWVRSSLTGTHSGNVISYGTTVSYVFAFTVSAANTWEYKTVTIPGPTVGTWNTNNGGGPQIFFNLGSGSSVSTAPGSWSTSAINWGATGAVSVVATNGATFYITGVQLEPGTVATPFERRSYGQELALCQRYFQKSYNIDVAPGTSGDPTAGLEYRIAAANSAGNMGGAVQYAVRMRTAASFTTYDRASPPNSGKVTTNGGNNISPSIITSGDRAITVFVGSSYFDLSYHWIASAEL
jgi:hypothetical protein